MTRYSIRKLGCEYVVFADEERVIRVASRRKAAKLIADASELLSVQSAETDQSAVKDAKFLDGEERFP
jgi:hypothetical protein